MLRVEDLNDIGLTEWCVKQRCECWFILLHHPTICISRERVEPSPPRVTIWVVRVRGAGAAGAYFGPHNQMGLTYSPISLQRSGGVLSAGWVVKCESLPTEDDCGFFQTPVASHENIFKVINIFPYLSKYISDVNNKHRGNVISGEKYLYSCKKYFRAGMARAAVEARAACVSAAQWPERPGEAPHSAAQCHHSAAAGTTTFLFWFLLSSTLHSRFSTWNSRKLIWTPWWRWVGTNCRVSTVFYLLSYNQSFVVTFSKHKYD